MSSALLTVPTATLKVGFENGYIQEINAAINSLDFNQTKEYIQRLAADKPLPDKDINRLIDIALLQKTRATMKKYPNLIQELDEHVQMSLGNRLGNDERSATIRKALLETKATINHTNNNNRTIPKI